MGGTVTEAELDSAIRKLCELYRFRRYHTYRSRRSPAGFPDLVLVKPPRVLFVELKSDDGRTTREQDAWLDDLSRCPGIERYLWKPQDLERAAAILAGNPLAIGLDKSSRTELGRARR